MTDEKLECPRCGIRQAQYGVSYVHCPDCGDFYLVQNIEDIPLGILPARLRLQFERELGLQRTEPDSDGEEPRT